MGISGNSNKILLYWYPESYAVEIENPLTTSNVVIKALKKSRPKRIFIESGTGIEIPLSAILWESMFSVFIVSGRQVVDFAQSIKAPSIEELKAHSAVLSMFSEYSTLSDKKSLGHESQKQLKSFVHRRNQLVDMYEAEKKNRYRSTKYVSSEITSHIMSLTSRVKRIDSDISALIRQSAIWRVNEKIKTTIRIEHLDYKGDVETTKMITGDIPQNPGLPDTYATVVVFKVTVYQRVTKKEGKVLLRWVVIK
jgi:hypothetical protein